MQSKITNNVSFQVLDALDAADFQKWLSIWNLWSNREVFAHPNYVKLYTNEKHRAYCAIFESPEGYVLYPFICRELKTEDFSCSLDIKEVADIITPYGYGGPFAWGYQNLEVLSYSFWSHFNIWVSNNNIVSEVIRFSLFEDDMLIYPGQREEKSQHIVVDLGLSEEELWMGFAHKVRKNVKRARENGIFIIIDTSGERLKDFFTVYNNTMDRRNASDRYYFPLAYFEQIRSGLANQFIFFHAIYNDKVISSELILVSADKAYSFLGGTYSDYFKLRPNDLLKYEIIIWAKKQGKRKFILGGGFKSGDGIYRYKRSFAPNERLSFFIGNRILRPDLYNLFMENKK